MNHAIFDLGLYSREIMGAFPDLTKTFNIGFYLGTVYARSFGFSTRIVTPIKLPVHTSFGDLGLIPRSQECWKGKTASCNFSVSSSRIYYKLCMVATSMNMITPKLFVIL